MGSCDIDIDPSEFTDECRLRPGANSGLYMLLDSSGNCVYIGQSQNLRGRLAQHRKAPPAPWTTARIAETPAFTESDRLRAEARLILALMPLANRGLNLGLANGRCWAIRWSAKTRPSRSRGQ